MGVRFALLGFTDGETPLDLRDQVVDAERSAAIAKRLYPRTDYRKAAEVSLLEGGWPPRGEFGIALFPSAVLIATIDAHLYNPVKLHQRYLKAGLGRTTLLITQRSYNDMFAYARWEDGRLIRSLSANPIGKVWENRGIPASFEDPFWAGDHPVGGDYPLPFHPLEMGEAGVEALFGLVYEGYLDRGLVQPEDIVLDVYRRTPRER